MNLAENIPGLIPRPKFTFRRDQIALQRDLRMWFLRIIRRCRCPPLVDKTTVSPGQLGLNTTTGPDYKPTKLLGRSDFFYHHI